MLLYSYASNSDTLVLYTYSATDPEYKRNLHFFVENGIFYNDGCDYYIIVQVDRGHVRLRTLKEVDILYTTLAFPNFMSNVPRYFVSSTRILVGTCYCLRGLSGTSDLCWLKDALQMFEVLSCQGMC